MRKSTLFISAVLTTFVMAMLAGVASAYQGMLTGTQAKASQPTAEQPSTQAEPIAEAMPTETQPVNFTPDQAAALAAQVLGHDDLYSVEATDLKGETVFLVTFTSGDLVYVSLDGQIRSIGKVQVETVVTNSGGGSNRREKGKNNGQSQASNQSSQQHEDHENHEGYDD